MLATTVFVVLLLLFINSVAEILLLLFVAALFSVYLASFTEFFTRRLGVARGVGLILALLGTVVIIGVVGGLIVPPVVTQFQQLIVDLPDQVVAAEV